jgi:DNA-binding NarL/FixJ family response regulator
MANMTTLDIHLIVEIEVIDDTPVVEVVNQTVSDLSYSDISVNETDLRHFWEFPSPREREVVQLLMAGRTNRQVANTLGIGVRTVESHRANAMAKLLTHDRHSLFIRARVFWGLKEQYETY